MRNNQVRRLCGCVQYGVGGGVPARIEVSPRKHVGAIHESPLLMLFGLPLLQQRQTLGLGKPGSDREANEVGAAREI